MRILVFTTSSNDTNKLIDSLRYLKRHDVHVFQYDIAWHRHVEQLQKMANTSREAAQALNEMRAGIYKLPEGVDVTRDLEMIREIDKVRPDLAIYISAWEGAFVPRNETLAAINRKVPLVHLCCDASDPPWWPQMAGFERDKCFSLTWNIDGGHDWPGGVSWDATDPRDIWGAKPLAYDGPAPRRFYPNRVQFRLERGLTTLTPVDPTYFDGPDIAFEDRPFRLAYAGNVGGYMRKGVVELLQAKFPGEFTVWQRDDSPYSYAGYCEFLRYCQCVINVPFSGSNAAKQVKGRIVECGWAGAAALDWQGAPSQEWFNESQLMTYAGVGRDLLDWVSWVFAHQTNVREFAEQLQIAVRTDHSPEVIWGQVFEAVGVDAQKTAV